MPYKNSPHMTDENNEGKVKRYVHQPLTFDHYGIRCTIKENGRIVITGLPVKASNGEMEYDEVDVPASLIFQLVTMLRATRTTQYVSESEAKNFSVSRTE
jgi:hypothetical protein